jgi:hypothetical protein
VSSGATRPLLAPASIDMLHTVMRASIESARMAAPAYSIVKPVPPKAPIFAMRPAPSPSSARPRPSAPSMVTRIVLRLPLPERLRGEHVRDFEAPMPNASAPRGAVGRGVRVAADERHAGLRDALLRPDHVDDALALVVHREDGDARAFALAASVSTCREAPGW